MTLMLWICIQFYMFPPNFMSTAYFIFGLLQAVTGYAASGKISEADYILVHHQKSAYKNAANEMDSALGIKHTQLNSIQCRKGVYN